MPLLPELVVCHNKAHLCHVKNALDLPAVHVVWGEALAGRQFDRIVAFVPTDGSIPPDEIEKYIDLLRLKLHPSNRTNLFLL